MSKLPQHPIYRQQWKSTVNIAIPIKNCDNDAFPRTVTSTSMYVLSFRITWTETITEYNTPTLYSQRISNTIFFIETGNKILSSKYAFPICERSYWMRKGGFFIKSLDWYEIFHFDRMIGSGPTVTRRMPTDLRHSLSDVRGISYFSPQEYECPAKLSTAELVQFR